MPKVTPLHNYISIKLLDHKNKTDAGIYLTEKTIGREKWAEVVGIGEGVPDMSGFKFKPDLKEGDKVYMFPHAWEECDLRDISPEAHSYFVSEGDILMALDDTTEIGVRPLGSWIIVELIKNEEKKSAGGIILADITIAKNRPQFAIVKAVGPGVRTPGAQVSNALMQVFDSLCDSIIPKDKEQEAYSIFKRYCEYNVSVVKPTVVPGNKVLIRKDTAMKIDFSDVGIEGEYYLIPEGDIYGILEQ